MHNVKFYVLKGLIVNKYRVFIAKTLYYIAEVEAKTPDEAEEKACNRPEKDFFLDDEEFEVYEVEQLQ